MPDADGENEMLAAIFLDNRNHLVAVVEHSSTDDKCLLMNGNQLEISSAFATGRSVIF